MQGSVRVTARRAGFRRAGFVFGPEPREIRADALTPEQLVAMLDEPMLEVTISRDGETFYSVPQAHLRAFRTLANATAGMAPGEVRAKLERVDLDPFADPGQHEALREAEDPGVGAGADHPDRKGPVPQPKADPDPTLPASGGTSDAGVELSQPTAENETGEESKPPRKSGSGSKKPTDTSD